MNRVVKTWITAGLAVGALTFASAPAAASTTAPDISRTGSTSAAAAADLSPAASGRRCFSATATHHSKTLLGVGFYNFSQRADWCSERGRITSVNFRQHYFTEASAFAVFRGLTEDSVTPTPAREVVSIKKATVENCVPHGGCLSAQYPYVELVLRADGSWRSSTGQ